MIPNIPAKAIFTLIGILGLCLVLLAFCMARKDAKEATGRATVAASQAGLGEDAADITAGVVRNQNDLDALERENREKINDTENANTSAGDTGDTGLSVLCSRRMYRDRPECRP